MLEKLKEALLYKESAERIAAALERIANALERGIPPLPETAEAPELKAEDYTPANDMQTYRQQVYDEITALEGPLDAEKQSRVDEFIRQTFPNR